MEMFDLIGYIKLVQGKLTAYTNYSNDLYEKNNKGIMEELREKFFTDNKLNTFTEEEYKNELEKVSKSQSLVVPPFDRKLVLEMLLITETEFNKLIIKTDDNKGTK